MAVAKATPKNALAWTKLIQTEVIKIQCVLGGISTIKEMSISTIKEMKEEIQSHLTTLHAASANAINHLEALAGGGTSVGGEGSGGIGIGDRITLAEPHILDRIEFGKNGKKGGK
jgi:hypothetical protein